MGSGFQWNGACDKIHGSCFLYQTLGVIHAGIRPATSKKLSWWSDLKSNAVLPSPPSCLLLIEKQWLCSWVWSGCECTRSVLCPLCTETTSVRVPSRWFDAFPSAMLCLEVLGCALPLQKHLPLIQDVTLLFFSPLPRLVKPLLLWSVQRGLHKAFLLSRRPELSLSVLCPCDVSAVAVPPRSGFWKRSSLCKQNEGLFWSRKELPCRSVTRGSS